MNAQATLEFFQGLERLLRAGLDLITVLELQLREHPKLARSLLQVLHTVRAGQSFSQALRLHVKLPHQLWVYILLGENTGDLAGACQLCIKTLEEAQAWKRLIWQLSFYPVLLLCTSFILLIVMMGFVLPEFASLYQTLDLELPQTTRWLLGLADWAPNFIKNLCLGLVLLILALVLLWRSPEGRFKLERVLFSVPGLKSIFRPSFEYQLCLQLGNLLKSGLTLLQALDFMIQGTRSPWCAQALQGVKQKIREGLPLSQSFIQAWSLSPPFKVLLTHAEQTGQLDEILLGLAEQHKSNLKQRQEKVKHLIQPLITLLLGGFLGFWILLLYYPMLQLGTNLG